MGPLRPAGRKAHELRGYGRHAAAGPGSVLPRATTSKRRIGDGPAQLVGASFGGPGVASEVAARRPELVSDLVLLDAPLPDHEWSEQLEEYSEEEERLLEEGDLDGATALNVAFWAPTLASTVGPMQRRAFELQAARRGPRGRVRRADRSRRHQRRAHW